MAYEVFNGEEQDEQARVAYYMRLFGHVRTQRVNFENQWEEAASLCWPEYRNSFAFGHNRPPGVKYTQFQVDSSGSIAAHRFMSIADALLTPFNRVWSVVKASDAALMKDRSVRQWFGAVNQTLWAYRYRPDANFTGQNQQNMQALGVFGNMGMFLDQMDTAPGAYSPGIRYMSTSPGEVYVLQNHQGRVDGFIRQFRWTARQAYGRWKDKLPLPVKTALEQNSQTRFDFLQFVLPRTDFDPFMKLSPRGMRWSSTYVSVAGYTILEDGGYRVFPLPYGRYMQAPEEDYGRGPAQMVLPELKTLNAEKGMFLKQGHRAGDPSYLLPGDDSLFDFKSHPGSYNYGGVNSDGRPLVHVLPTGEIQVTKEMLDESRSIVNDAFLVTLYNDLFDPKKSGELSARAVIEATNARGIFLSPLGRQFTEYLGPMHDRELDILSYLKLLPPAPPALKEARGQFRLQYEYTGPLGRMFAGHEIAGFMRTLDIAERVAKVSGDDAIMDHFEFDQATPDIAQEQFVRPSWMSTPARLAQKRKDRARAQAEENRVKSLPGEAAMAKARAISDKAGAGQNIGGVLSGTPEGGMPMMPGQNAPGGRAF
jgi:hypothetical protein